MRRRLRVQSHMEEAQGSAPHGGVSAFNPSWRRLSPAQSSVQKIS